MSDPDREISEVGDSHRGADGGDDDDDDYRESGTGGTQRKKQREYGFRKKFTKAKQVFRFPFTKSKKQIKSQRKLSSSSNGDRGFCSGCFCFSQPRTSESTNTSDPNDPNFTYDMLKTLIEKNDFYSKECNTHLR